MYSSNRNSSFQEEMATATGLPEDVEKLLTCPVCLDVSFILLNITLRYDWLVLNFFINPGFFFNFSYFFQNSTVVFFQLSSLAIIHHDFFTILITWC